MRLWFCLSFFVVLCLEHFPGTLADERNNRDYPIRTHLHGPHIPRNNRDYPIRTHLHGHHIPRNVPESEEKTEQFLRDLSEISRLQRRPPGFTPFRGKFHSQSLRDLSEISRLQRRPPGFTPFRGKFHSQSLRDMYEIKGFKSAHGRPRVCPPGEQCPIWVG
uniref:Kininogen-2 n=1 Tax=Bombina orientalis TaxID=8346 RepID=BRK2_BOMOR|nr:RecName: Full=Kininogen-2; AltName: Full=BOK-2; Contains: RecName: Full=[Thr6]-bradykinin; Contains: RecName: Full=Bradykinin inhibitor peptide DV-28; Short=DV-28 amide; Flags: Precursor [Bombina orientalis]CAC70660.1 kininogen-2 [Bombina orientalis]